MDDNIRIVEINGIKLEVDMRTAKRIDSYKVGDAVRVLTKNYSGYDVKYGVIIDFAEFENLPTIEVLAIAPDKYSSGGLEFYSINEKTEDIEIAPMGVVDTLFKRDEIIEKMSSEINQKEEEVRTMKMKKNLFLEKFGQYFNKPLETV